MARRSWSAVAREILPAKFAPRFFDLFGWQPVFVDRNSLGLALFIGAAAWLNFRFRVWSRPPELIRAEWVSPLARAAHAHRV